MDPCCLLHVSFDSVVYHLLHLFADQVRCHTDDTVSADGENGKGIIIVAAIDQELTRFSRVHIHL